MRISGKEFKAMRVYNNIDRQEIAEKLNMSKNYITILENEIEPIPEDIYIEWTTLLKGKFEGLYI